MYGYDTRIRYSECDGEEILKIESIIDHFQDIATVNSVDIGYRGRTMMEEDHQAWVLSGWQIDVSRYPEAYENVRVVTVPYEFKGFIGNRNCGIVDEAGNFLVKANSIWALMDMEKGRPVKVTPEMEAAYQVGEKFDMEYAPRRIELPKEEGLVLEPVQVSKWQLDTLNHMNNGQHVRLAISVLEDLDEDIKAGTKKALRPKRLRVEYKTQAHLGDLMIPHVWNTEDGKIVSFMNEEGKIYSTTEIKEN